MVNMFKVLRSSYPSGLTREVQFMLAAMVIVVNLAIYIWLVIHRRGQRSDG